MILRQQLSSKLLKEFEETGKVGQESEELQNLTREIEEGMERSPLDKARSWMSVVSKQLDENKAKWKELQETSTCPTQPPSDNQKIMTLLMRLSV